MPASRLIKQVFDLGSWTINGTNTVALAPGVPIRVQRLILRYTTGNTTLGNIVTVQRRPIAGVASNQVSLFTVTTTATTAAGDVDFVDLSALDEDGTAISGAPGLGGQTYYSENDENYPVIYPGQDIAFVSGGQGTAGVVNAYVEGILLPFNEAEIEAAINSVVKLTPTIA